MTQVSYWMETFDVIPSKQLDSCRVIVETGHAVDAVL